MHDQSAVEGRGLAISQFLIEVLAQPLGGGTVISTVSRIHLTDKASLAFWRVPKSTNTGVVLHCYGSQRAIHHIHVMYLMSFIVTGQ